MKLRLLFILIILNIFTSSRRIRKGIFEEQHKEIIEKCREECIAALPFYIKKEEYIELWRNRCIASCPDRKGITREAIQDAKIRLEYRLQQNKEDGLIKKIKQYWGWK